MRHLDLFSGIGGFALAASWVWEEEHEIVSFCEIDPFCQKVLKKHWPDVPIVSDIREMKGSDFVQVDLLTGGFPCQPFSTAGKRKGKADDRFLWPEMLRIISEAKPSWIIGENVPGIASIDYGMVVRQVLSDLEEKGYRVLPPFLIPACSINALHTRERIWFVAYSQQILCNSYEIPDTFSMGKLGFERSSNVNSSLAISKWLELKTNRRTLRDDDGFSEAVDRVGALGNAVVPQVVVPLMKIIKELMI